MENVTLWKAKIGMHKSGKALVKEWTAQRQCSPETADKWLKVFQAAEPKESFTLSITKPKSRKTA